MRSVSLIKPRADRQSRLRSGSPEPTRAQLLEEVERLRMELAIEHQELEAQEVDAGNSFREMEASRERYVDLYDKAPVGYMNLDYNGCLTRINLTGARMLGAERSHLRRSPFVTFVAEGDRRKFLHHLTHCRKGKGEITTELRLRSREGKERFVQIVSAPARKDDLARNRFPTVLTDITARRQAEEALRRSESRFRALIERSAETITVVDATGKVLYKSPNVIATLGYTAAEMEGRSGFDFTHPEDLPAVQKTFAEILAEPGRMRVIEARIRHKDGSWRWLEITGKNLLDDPAIGGVVLNSRDITERKQAREALELASRLPQENPSPVIRLQEGRVLTFANPPAKSVLEKWGCAVGEKAPAKIVRLCRAALAGGKRGETELICDRRAYAVAVVPVLPANYVNLYFSDITKRKQAEDALRVSETRFRVMANSAPVLMWISGPDKQCTWFNQTWLDFVGRPLERELGNGWAENVHPDDFQACLLTYVTSFDARREFKMEYRLRRHDGQYRWLLDYGLPLNGDGGGFAGYIGSCIDITESRNAADLLRRSHDELERRVKERTAALRETEQRYRQLVEGMPDAVLVVRNGLVTLANPAAQELLGVTRPEQLIDRPVLDWVHPHSRSFVHELMRQALQHFLPLPRIDQKVVRRNGGVREVRIAAERFVEGSTPGVLLVLKDITERKELEKRLLEVSEQEQQRIGQDLHDGLCQHLTALKFKAALLEQKLRKRFRFGPRGFAEIEKRLNRIIEEARTVARGLSPVSLNIHGLGAALHELAGEVTTLTKMPCVCRVDKSAQVTDATVAMHLYRIAQEAMNNAVKHSRGTKLWLRLARRDGRLKLTVRDNGVGFSLAKGGKPGLGVHNMDYRARVIGGTLKMQPLSSGGLQVTCALPDPVVSAKKEVSHGLKKRKTNWRK